MSKITYRQIGDYLIPNLKLPPEEERVTLGKWGMMYKDYFEKYNNVFFSLLISQGRLYQHCAEVENQANEMYDLLIEQMKETEGITEELKEQDQLELVQRMGNIQQRANDIVCSELMYD